MTAPYTPRDEPYVVRDDAPYTVSDPDINVRNVLRSFMLGATLNLGDSKRLPEWLRLDPERAAAFQREHGIVDAIARAGGSTVAPLLATLAAPEALAGLGGAALLGVGTGAIAGAAEGAGKTATERLQGGALGGALGGAFSAAGYGASKLVGKAVNAIRDYRTPARTVARAVSQLVEPEDLARQAAVNRIPNGPHGEPERIASLATSTIEDAPKGKAASRFLPMLRDIGANPDAARRAEAVVQAQHATIKETLKDVGERMDALDAKIPLTRDVRSAIRRAQAVLGDKAPKIPTSRPPTRGDPKSFLRPEPQMLPAPKKAAHVDLHDLRDALTRLRELSRSADRRGPEASGAAVFEIKGARNALQKVIYKHAPEFRELDRQYSLLKDQQRQAERVLSTIQKSRNRYAAKTAYKTTTISGYGVRLGPRGPRALSHAYANQTFVNRPGVAAEVAKYIVTPTETNVLQSLQPFLDVLRPQRQAAINSLFTAPASIARGLLATETTP